MLETRRKSGQIINDYTDLSFYLLYIFLIISKIWPVLCVQKQVWNNRTEFSLPSKPVLLNISCKFMHCISIKVKSLFYYSVIQCNKPLKQFFGFFSMVLAIFFQCCGSGFIESGSGFLAEYRCGSGSRCGSRVFITKNWMQKIFLYQKLQFLLFPMPP